MKRTCRTIPLLTFLLLFAFFLSLPCIPEAEARDNIGLIMRGVGRTLVSVFQLPVSILHDSVTSFPFGIITGTVKGTIRTVVGTVVGGIDIARGAAPYAKYMIFLL